MCELICLTVAIALVIAFWPLIAALLAASVVLLSIGGAALIVFHFGGQDALMFVGGVVIFAAVVYNIAAKDKAAQAKKVIKF